MNVWRRELTPASEDRTINGVTKKIVIPPTYGVSDFSPIG